MEIGWEFMGNLSVLSLQLFLSISTVLKYKVYLMKQCKHGCLASQWLQSTGEGILDWLEGVEVVEPANRLLNNTTGDYGSLDYGGSIIDVEGDRF